MNAWCWPPCGVVLPSVFERSIWPVVSVIREILFASGDTIVIPAPPPDYVHVVKSGTSMLLNTDATAGFRAIWKTNGITLQDSGTSLAITAGQATNAAQLVFGQVFTSAGTLALSAVDGTKGVIAIDYEVQPASLWVVANLNLTTAFQTVPIVIPPNYVCSNAPATAWVVAPASHSLWVSNNDGAARTIEMRLTRGALTTGAINWPSSFPLANQTRSAAAGMFPSLITGDVLEARVTALTTANTVRIGYNGRLIPQSI